jgi:geranylgeranyl pyrophosphate synthase
LVNIAPALILINGAVDIHDDIIDRSKQKDGRPTVYGKFGEEVALLVGDALFMKGFLMLNLVSRSLDGDKYEKVMNTLKQGLFELGQAEVMELQWRGVADIKAEYYLKVAQKKAADVEALMRLGAILGNAKKSETEALGKYGRIVGFISILRDDIIDMTLQEEFRHRLAHECPPLPLIYAIEDGKVRVALLNLIRDRIKTERDYVKIFNLTRQGYGFQRAKSCVDQLVKNGKASIIKLRKRRAELHLILTSLAELKEYETSNPNGI